jgi:hypothetical protein
LCMPDKTIYQAYREGKSFTRQGVIRDFGLDEGGSRQIRRRAAVARYLVDQPADATLGFASPVSVRIIE